MARRCFRMAVLDALAPERGERALFIADLLPDETEGPASAAARGLAQEAKARGLASEAVFYRRTIGHGAEPPEPVWRAAWGKAYLSLPPMLRARLFEKTADEKDLAEAVRWARAFGDEAPDVLVATTTHSTSHTSFRRLLTEGAGTRYASMPLFEEELLRAGGPLDVDAKGLRRTTRRLSRPLRAPYRSAFAARTTHPSSKGAPSTATTESRPGLGNSRRGGLCRPGGGVRRGVLTPPPRPTGGSPRPFG